MVAEHKKDGITKSEIESANLPTVSHVVATSDGTVAIALTAEDKSVNVFQIEAKGELRLLSKR
jgi:hypothetical protein